ncbi:MAG: hypothetical protein ACK5IP_14665, partial [Paracoccus sp. (in: a-proteobacteria)]
TTVGRWYRFGYSVAGRSAGTVTPRLSGGSTVSGASFGSNGIRTGRLQAVSGNNSFDFVATAPFNGSLADMVAYRETPACIAQGTHYLWLEPQSADGIPGPVAGPFTLEVI